MFGCSSRDGRTFDCSTGRPHEERTFDLSNNRTLLSLGSRVMVIEVPYRYQDDWGRDRVTVLRYQRDPDPCTGHIRWALLPGQWDKMESAAQSEVLRVVALG